jgi:hypothetical protein
MTENDQQIGERFVKLALAINEHLPGYVDSYFGPEPWMQEAKQTGKIPLPDLVKLVESVAADLSHSSSMNTQRKDFLARQTNAMQMSLRLLGGEKVSLAEEVRELYDVQPEWKSETIFEEAHRELDQILPVGGSLLERNQNWKKSIEIPPEKVQEVLLLVTERLRGLAHQKFNLPEEESFTVEFVSNQPWGAYNNYLGNYRSLIQINTDQPIRIPALPGLIAHEGYPGHHTELSIKDEKLIRQKNYVEHVLTLINSPSCVTAEGIATSALEMVLTDDELEDWYQEELLPCAGLREIDPRRIIARNSVLDKLSGLDGNAAFMLHDQNAPPDEISAYLQRYGLYTEKEAQQTISFISNPLYRSYIFTYFVGYDLLKQLFAKADRGVYFKRLLEEPVTPSQIRQWIDNPTGPN